MSSIELVPLSELGLPWTRNLVVPFQLLVHPFVHFSSTFPFFLQLFPLYPLLSLPTFSSCVTTDHPPEPVPLNLGFVSSYCYSAVKTYV